MTPLLRDRSRHGSDKVGTIELFFDLVFVFAVTQLSHTLLADLTLTGLGRVSLLLLAVWWVWIYTSWVTNWLDPEKIPVRVCLFALMIVGMAMSVAIPKAFAATGWVFAVAYVSMQVGRALFFLWAVRDGPRHMQRNFQRILAWASLSGVLWLAGGLGDEGQRPLWWTLALLVDFIAPWVYFHVPGLGRSSTTDWDVDIGHMAERCGLFIIIALGESLLITGATFAEGPWSATPVAGLLAAVLGSILMWWIYFDTGAERAHHRIKQSGDPGRHARAVYTYLHVLIVAGIIVCAVADELVLTHPDHGTPAALAAIIGGPACFLVGAALLKWVTNDRVAPPLSHLAGLALLGVLAWLGVRLHLSPLWTGMATTAIFAVVAIWEALALRRGGPEART